MAGIPTPLDASALTRRITALENRLKTLEGARTLTAATISSGGLRIVDDGELYVDGLAQFGGDMRVSGTLSLPAGIIDNAALASPAAFGRSGGGESSFNVPTAGALVAQISITVPPGYSTAIVMAVGTAAVRNPTTGPAFLYVGAQIGAVTPNLTWGLAPAGGYTNASGSASRLLTGLSGGEITIATRVAAQGSAWNNTTSMANTDAIAIFLR